MKSIVFVASEQFALSKFYAIGDLIATISYPGFSEHLFELLADKICRVFSVREYKTDGNKFCN